MDDDKKELTLSILHPACNKHRATFTDRLRHDTQNNSYFYHEYKESLAKYNAHIDMSKFVIRFESHGDLVAYVLNWS
jgi:hypothetical protein